MVLTDVPLTGLSNLQKRKLMKLFGMYDASNTGVLKVSNFQHIVDRLAAIKGWSRDSSDYHHLTDKLMHRWIHIRSEVKDRLDHKPTEAITLDEWFLYYEQVLSDNAYRDHINEVANLIFDAIDIDASGSLDLQEWRNLFQVYGIPVIYAEEAFAKIDQNRDGHLSKEELLPLIEDFYYSQNPDAPGNFIFGPF
ncbi:MAG: EF-hand domain-containing protein [Cyanobacteria bacterium J06636_16]